MNREEIIRRLQLSWSPTDGLPKEPVNELVVGAMEAVLKLDSDELENFVSNLRAFICVECGRRLAIGESCHCRNDE